MNVAPLTYSTTNLFHTNTPQQQYANNDNAVPNEGISIEKGESIMHLIGDKLIKSSPTGAFNPDKIHISTPESIRDQLRENAQQRDTKAMIYLDDEPVMIIGSKSITSRNIVADIASRNNGDADQTIAELKALYGNRLKVETYNDNSRPTNAEVFEIFNGRPYADYVEENYNAMVASHMQQERDKLLFEQQQLAFANTPVDAVYKVNGKIIASHGTDNVTNLHLPNLLTTLDELDIDRTAAKTLFENTGGREVTHEELGTMLKGILGDKLETDQPARDNRPTRQSVSKTAFNQWDTAPSYNASTRS